MEKILLLLYAYFWTPPHQPLKYVRVFLDTKHLYSAWAADAAGYRGGWVTARVYPRVFLIFQHSAISSSIHYIIFNHVLWKTAWERGYCIYVHVISCLFVTSEQMNKYSWTTESAFRQRNLNVDLARPLPGSFSRHLDTGTRKGGWTETMTKRTLF